MISIKKDVVVVGAGLLGSSVALHLAGSSSRSISVVDLDLEGVFSSSELNAGGVRATWNNPVNAAISRISIDYYAKHAEEVGFRQRGYFWMFSKANWSKASGLLKANKNLQDLGVQYLSPTEVTQKFPFIDKTEDMGGATFSPKDGLLNPNLLKLHYRKMAKHKGVEFHDRIWVHHVDFPQDGTVELKAWVWPQQMSHDEIKKVLTQSQDKIPEHAEALVIKTKTLVNCSGAWAKRFAQCMGTTCESSALRRQVSIFECREVDLTPFGMFVDCSGVYFHTEANYILGGYATPEEAEGYNFEYDGESFFEQHIWPALYERSTKFESLKHITGWAGLYEVSPDKSAIVGQVPGFKNVFEAHSFSGRGAMQSFGAGLGLSELILKGQFDSLDLSSLTGARFAEGHLLSEGLLI